MLRKTLEREADRLGIPWLVTWSDSELTEAIAIRESKMMNSEINQAEWPECYGLYWAANKEEACRGCGAKEGCLHRFSTVRLPDLKRALRSEGFIPTLTQISDRAQVDEDSILIAMNYAFSLNESSSLDEINSEEPELGSTEEEDIQKEEVENTEDGVLPVKQVKMFEGKDKEEEEDVSSPRKKKKKNVPAKKVAASAKKTSSEIKEVSNPPKAGSAQSASDLATIKQRKRDRARHVLVQAQKRAEKTRVWGNWVDRWIRERERNKWIGAVPIGGILNKIYKDKFYRVKCLQHRWLNMETEKAYPTLYAVTKSIAGTYVRNSSQGRRKLCNFSPTTFWKESLSQAMNMQYPKDVRSELKETVEQEVRILVPKGVIGKKHVPKKKVFKKRTSVKMEGKHSKSVAKKEVKTVASKIKKRALPKPSSK